MAKQRYRSGYRPQPYNPTLKAFNDFQKEQKKQLSIVFPAACIVLWKEFGYRTRRIAKILNASYTAIKEAADEINSGSGDQSMLAILESETGIVITIPGRAEYSEYDRLCLGNVVGKKKHGMTGPELVYFYQRLAAWCAPQAIAALCIALHREERFGFGKLETFVSKIDEIRKTLGEEPRKYKKLLAEETDIDPGMLSFW